MVLEGELHVRHEGETMVAKAGDVMFIPKGSSIEFGTPSTVRFMYVAACELAIAMKDFITEAAQSESYAQRRGRNSSARRRPPDAIGPGAAGKPPSAHQVYRRAGQPVR